MVARLFKFAIVVALVAILVFFLTQEPYQRPFKQAWRDVQRSDGWKTLKKTWEKSYKKTQQLFLKAQQGKLSEDIEAFLEAASQSYLGIGLAELQGYLQKINPSTGGLILFTIWLVLGYLFYVSTSPWTTFFVMAISLLLHSVYGQTWCLYQLCVTAGLLLYFVSLVANNVVLAVMVVLVIYAVTTLSFFLSSSGGNLYILEQKIDHIGHRTSIIEQNIASIDRKLERIRRKKNRSSSGDE